jgi:uncharacterized OB-fold protein
MSGEAQRGYLEPVPTVDTRPWWEELRKGRLTIPHCDACERRFFPPQPFCPHCGAAGWRLVEPDGRGTVYSWVVANRAFAPEFAQDVPYGIVAVDLVDGGRLIGRYTGSSDELGAGLAVRAHIQEFGEVRLLAFAPAADG